MHPSHELPKTYLVKIKGVLSDDAVSRLEAGVFLKDGKTAPARVKRLRKEEANSWVEITIHEGKKRQVRRMIDHVGNSVIRLKRVKVGNLPLGNLPPGSYRYLTPDEVKMLKDMAEGKIRETKDERAARAPAVAVKKPGRIKRREDLGELSRAAAGGRATIFAAREKHYTERRKATRERGTVRGARDEDKTRRREDASRGRKERRAWGEDKTGRRKPGEFSRAAAGERGKERRTGVSRKKPRAGSQRSNERNMKPAGKPRRPLR
jgi:23S rRNA pseudouridine2605 synthase